MFEIKLESVVLGLATSHLRNHNEHKSRYVRVISPDIPSKTIASLHTVGHGCRVPLQSVQIDERRKTACDSGLHTLASHRRLSLKMLLNLSSVIWILLVFTLKN